MNKPRALQAREEVVCGLRPMLADADRVDRQGTVMPMDAIEHGADLQRKVEVVVLKQVAAADHDGIRSGDLVLPARAKPAQPAFEPQADKPPPKTVADLAHPPTYVPGTMKASDLLVQLQAEQQHLAIVVDEYGGAVGIVTIEDLLEIIVGDIDDSGRLPGTPSDVAAKLKALERENRELRQANEILRKASAYFAQAELDRRFKP